MPRVAVVTGAGSGVGRAVAHALATRGFHVGIIGRRKEPLDETIKLAPSHSGKIVAYPCDVADENAIAELARRVKAELGLIEVLVNAAGTNIPKRDLEHLSNADFKHLIDVNLTGAYLCVHEFLPAMRERGGGTIVNVISDAALAASPKAGAAYVASKFGLRGVTQSINAEQRANGIRACSLLPGDIDTPLLDKRPSPPPAEARTKMLKPEDIAQCVMLVIDLPPRAIVEELLIRPA
jgi:NAD(P)-dependent dehydrogenase (short-subunit alcohol dehydrogenase family)